nr:cytochrome P450 84A1-like [Coffea arabica]
MEKKMNLLRQISDAETMLIIAIVTLVFLYFLSRFRRKNHPPGPKGLPFIGNMMIANQISQIGLAKLANQYGGIFRVKLPFLNTVVVSSPDLARQVLQVQDNIFSNRPATIAISYLTYERADMAFAQYGPMWRQMRKLCVMKLFSSKRAASWDAVRDEVDDMIRVLDSRAGLPVNLGKLFFRLSRKIIYRAAFGSRTPERQDEFIQILQEISTLLNAFNLADFIPWLKWADLQGFNKRLISSRASLDAFIDSITEDHMEKKKNVNGSFDQVEGDMVDELLAFMGDDEGKVTEAGNLQKSLRLTKNNVKALIMDAMFGGTETVGSAIEWIMTELIKNPNDLKRVQEELANVVGLHRKVQESDMNKLTYFKSCFKEVLRLHPPIPLLLHETMEDSEVAGYHIPAKSRVMVNVWAIGRNKDTWGEDADTFKPSRFLSNGAPDYKGSNFEFIPFGSGRRSCPGMQLGLFAVEMAVAHLLHCFQWELPDGMKPSDVDTNDVFGLAAPRASRLVAVPTPRLLCPLV